MLEEIRICMMQMWASNKMIFSNYGDDDILSNINRLCNLLTCPLIVGYLGLIT